MGIPIPPILKDCANIADLPRILGILFNTSPADHFSIIKQSTVNCTFSICLLPLCFLKNTLSTQIQMAAKDIVIIACQPTDILISAYTIRFFCKIQYLHQFSSTNPDLSIGSQVLLSSSAGRYQHHTDHHLPDRANIIKKASFVGREGEIRILGFSQNEAP